MSEVPARWLRASDRDRDNVAERLRAAAGDGRITLDELDERLSRVYAAKTYADLERVTEDLPAPQAGAGVAFGASVPATADSGPSPKPGLLSRFTFSLMAGWHRRGRWTVPRHHVAVACMGGVSIDLREARFTDRQVTIHGYALMGGITIVVPEDAEVDVAVLPLMGGVDGRAEGPGKPGAPRVRVVGAVCMGGLEVKRKPVRAVHGQKPAR